MASVISLQDLLHLGQYGALPSISTSFMEAQSLLEHEDSGSRPSEDRLRTACDATTAAQDWDRANRSTHTYHLGSDKGYDEVSSDSVLEAMERGLTKEEEENAQLWEEATQVTAVLMRRAMCDSEEMRSILRKKADGTLSRDLDDPEAMLADIRRYIMADSPVHAEQHSRICVYCSLKVQRTKARTAAFREALDLKVNTWLQECDNPKPDPGTIAPAPVREVPHKL